jgi:hypothetical protein
MRLAFKTRSTMAQKFQQNMKEMGNFWDVNGKQKRSKLEVNVIFLRK